MNKQSFNQKYAIIPLLSAIIVTNGFFAKVSAQNISTPETTDSVAVTVNNQEFPSGDTIRYEEIHADVLLQYAGDISSSIYLRVALN